MTYEASTFLYAIAVAIFALGGMVGGFTGGWIANKSGRFVSESALYLSTILYKKHVKYSPQELFTNYNYILLTIIRQRFFNFLLFQERRTSLQQYSWNFRSSSHGFCEICRIL